MQKFIIILILILNITACTKSVVVKTTDLLEKNSRTHRTANQIKQDSILKQVIIENIDKNKKDFMTSNNLKNFGCHEINVVEGRVLLTGILESNIIKKYILNKIRENPKVTEILDESVISSESKASTKDFFTKEAIKNKLLFKSEIKTINYEFSVINGIVYIIGISENYSELEMVTKAISTVQGVKKVVSYIILKDNRKRINNNI